MSLINRYAVSLNLDWMAGLVTHLRWGFSYVTFTIRERLFILLTPHAELIV